MLKKILICVLACAMILPLAACPASTPTGGGGGGGGGNETEWADNLGEMDLGGDTITISCYDKYEYEVYGEDDGDWIENEIYKRNTALATRFNATVVPDAVAAIGTNDAITHYDKVVQAFNTSSVAFDMLAMYAYLCGKMVVNEWFCDWRDEIPYCSDSIKAKNAWWPENINVDCTVNGYQFMAVSDFCLTAMEMCYSVVFNQELAQTNNIASQITRTTGGGTYDTLYNVVRGGDWTIDNFYAVVKDFWQPAVGKTSDGRTADDIYGLYTDGSTASDAFAEAFGVHYIINNGIDEPQLWTVNQKVINAIEKCQNLYGSIGVYTTPLGIAGDLQFFTDGHAVFGTLALEDLKTERLHQMENNAENPFGVLPYPKYDINQTEYKTGSRDHYTLLAVPTEFLDADEGHRKTVGAMVEAMSAYNWKNVTEQYYTLIITHNNTHDEESAEMIDLIMKGRMYDLSIYHYADLALDGSASNSNLGLFFRYMIGNRDKQATQYWNSYSEKVQEEFDILVAKYNEITGK